MIRVNIGRTCITASGHAQRLPGAPPGHNIVCAAYSTLTITLIEGLEKVAGVEIDWKIAPGYASISWNGQLNEIGRALVATYILGLQGVQGSYGEVEIVIEP